MKKALSTVLIFLLLASAFQLFHVPKVSATATEDLHVAYGLPKNVPREPMPENSTAEDYLNTTNPYSDVASPQGALDEVDDLEGNHPLYVLVFGDGEEMQIWRSFPLGGILRTWREWAMCQLERGDEALVANFGIDIRILGFLGWDSNDNLNSMYDLWDELETDTEQYLGQWYNGEWWSSYVDVIIGITAQETPGDDRPIAGLSPRSDFLDQGRTFVLLKWQVYWMDDNLVQHEISHLYYAPEHPEPQPPAPCCAMAYHTHPQGLIWEDGLWWVFDRVACAFTAYFWCTSCHQVIQQNSGRYPLRTLTISSFGGTTNPAPGTYLYGNGISVTVTASAYSSYYFSRWSLDGAIVYSNPITVTMNSDHTLKAYFAYSDGGGGTGGCPFVYAWNGTQYVVDNNLLGDSEASSGADVEDYYRLEQSLVQKNGKYELLMFCVCVRRASLAPLLGAK